MRSMDEVESQVRTNESRLSEEDILPADTVAIQNLRDQLGVRGLVTQTQPHRNVVRLLNLWVLLNVLPEVADRAR